MFGAYPIGSFPYGSIVTETGLAILDIGTAEATADANNIQPLAILSLGNASATASGIDIFIGQSLNLGTAEASVSANDLEQKILPSLGFATAIASAQSPTPIIRFKIGRADAGASALNIQPKVLLDVPTAEATAQALDFSGVGLGTLTASASIEAVDILPKVLMALGVAEAQSSAVDGQTLIQLLTETAGAEASANAFTQSITQPLESAEAIAEALSLADIVYVVDDVPEIQVDRTSTQAVVKTTNPSDLYNVRIFRADDHRGTFSTLVSNHDESSDYTDSGLDASKNFKYKCAFIVVGTKGGVEYIVVGERSAPVYTIGTNVL